MTYFIFFAYLVGVVFFARDMRKLDLTLSHDLRGGWKYIIPTALAWFVTVPYIYGGAWVNSIIKQIEKDK